MTSARINPTFNCCYPKHPTIRSAEDAADGNNMYVVFDGRLGQEEDVDVV